MVTTTFLHDGELDQPTGDTELDELLAEARRRTGCNYQVVTHHGAEACGFLRLRRRTIQRTQLYVEVGGMAPWQALTCASDIPTIKAFLLGLVNGLKCVAPVAASNGPVMFGRMLEGDFRKDTLTFVMERGYYMVAGRYAISPVVGPEKAG